MGRDPKARPDGWRDIDTLLKDAAQVERLRDLVGASDPKVKYLEPDDPAEEQKNAQAVMELINAK
jgi:hypothetical protein